MPRVKRGFKARHRRKKVMLETRGFIGAKSKIWKTAVEALHHAWAYSTRDRKLRKRNFRGLWNIRIGAAVKQLGLSYSKFIHGLKVAGVSLNRKMLAEMAVSDSEAFKKIVEIARGAFPA